MRWPAGVASSAVACGIKQAGTLDLGIVSLDRLGAWAGTFTRNAAAAPCIGWSKDRRSRPIKAIVVNSGNANACTGAAGERAVRTTAAAAAAALGCDAGDVVVASTGVIGVPLPAGAIAAALPKATERLESDADGFAHAILTTDSRVKMARATAGRATVAGVAKGAAMCAPDMATMLAFIATDAALDASDLSGALSAAVEDSFNRISIDACESTNDAVFLLSSGRVGDVDENRFRDAVAEVCRDLAHQIVADAEGATRVVHVRVTGAADEASAVALGRAVAASALWRAAAHGGDPNWGRIVAALGAVDRSLDVRSLSLSIGSEVLFRRGEPCGSLEAAAKVMAESSFDVGCHVGRGAAEAELLSADLSPSYVDLNAFATT